ncbi:hypothetical protein Sez_0165 [Streptococcus equi subsp. zooepidemicus MGCS10565]|uniref:Uncharacterized protein n=1 Tax=Streptococcus equi subsp. zooepidemicus (strain MGCS10565) TaxID=552526 RepID=B4U0A0_STREM|nr:hypothetical protein Sez_0165 [Streptococcus equi subsp. zooepidemicus MGCS10565]AEJ24387.1 conserved hypothetical protein [Streptococcus equi subsp. zooepidemicus ATCC 35246]
MTSLGFRSGLALVLSSQRGIELDQGVLAKLLKSPLSFLSDKRLNRAYRNANVH